ncbi:hypothetical protein MAR_008412 [Mya arenaria]|uniref:Ribosomal protein L36 n=1 Tax=Mya arenaria TaxID=6604 RepID=A0ABY7DXW1_MYAAR|nr:hypothetical protein MAR_008412 [Mya arenaria]
MCVLGQRSLWGLVARPRIQKNIRVLRHRRECRQCGWV